VQLSLPTRISLPKTFAFSLLFFCVQQYQHTNLTFSLLYFAFVILSVVGFNLAEGFTRLTGAYIFWFSTLIVIFGVMWKAVVREPADSNLLVPNLDIALDTGSMVMMIFVVMLNKRLDFRELGLGGGFSGRNLDLTVAGLGCIVASALFNFLGAIFGQAPGGFLSAIAQINFFFPLGIILATAGAIKDSNGTRSTSVITLLGISLASLQGVLAFSKQGMLTPMVCWLIGSFYMRLRVRPIHVIVVVALVILSFKFVSPLSESRDLAEGLGFTERIQLVGYLLANPGVLQAHIDQLHPAGPHEEGSPTYYNEPQGSLVERLSMMSPDDRLNAYTARGNYEGMAPVIEWFTNMVPRFLYPGKTNDYTGNYFAHKAGGYLSADDTTTGISFSPVASAYNCEGWGGILWLMPAIWILLFTSVDFVAGDLRKYPWGLLVIVWFGHAAPESLLSGMIYYISYGNLGMLFAIIVSTRLAPIVGSLFAGKVTVVETRPIRRARIVSPARPQLQE
jgi:hypothetical protein